jgi:hypothetical protein
MPHQWNGRRYNQDNKPTPLNAPVAGLSLPVYDSKELKMEYLGAIIIF